jgi:hypothetical protein
VGITSRGMMRRLGRCFSRVHHRVVPDRERVPERCHASGAAEDVGSDAPAWAQRAEHAVDGGVGYVSRVLSVSPRARRINAQRIARSDPYNARNCLPPKNYVERYSRLTSGARHDDGGASADAGSGRS